MHRFEAAVNIDALLGAVRDYFERVTREFHVKGPGGGPQQPRDVEVSKHQSHVLPLFCLFQQWRKQGCLALHINAEKAEAASHE